jgi:predicted MPP superfamily phosphohydrolase
MNVLRALLHGIEVGARRPLLVRRENVAHIGVRKRVLFASDLHLRKHGPRSIVDGLVEIASRECPDLVLLGGDLVDWTSGVAALQALVRRLSHVAPVGAVSGNHDRWIGVARVRAAVLAGGGRWLEDAPWPLTSDCAVYGSREQPVQAASYHLLCTHHPGPFALERHFDLTLSGHLHGGQFVFYQRHGRLYPGAFFYRWNGLRFDDEDGKTLLISRGVQDTLPLRWNCPREVLIVDI